MRSAPFQRFVVANSLGRLLFLTRSNFLSSRKLSSEKISRKLFWRASKCVCAINVFGSHRHSAVLSQIPSCPFVAISLRSVKLFRVCVGKYQIPQKMRHCAFGCARSNFIVSCAFICAQSNSFVFLRNNALFR